MSHCQTLYIVTETPDNSFSDHILDQLHHQEGALYEEELPDSRMHVILLTGDQWQIGHDSVPPDEKVMFIGREGFAHESLKNVPIRYQRFGISYGWTGNRAVLRANPYGFKSYKEYKVFLKLLEREELTAHMNRGKDLDMKQMLAMAAVAVFVPFGSVLVGGKLLKDWFSHTDAVRLQQYVYGVLLFYKHDLSLFMNGVSVEAASEKERASGEMEKTEAPAMPQVPVPPKALKVPKVPETKRPSPETPEQKAFDRKSASLEKAARDFEKKTAELPKWNPPDFGKKG